MHSVCVCVYILYMQNVKICVYAFYVYIWQVFFWIPPPRGTVKWTVGWAQYTWGQ